MVEVETHGSATAFGQSPGQRPANYLPSSDGAMPWWDLCLCVSLGDGWVDMSEFSFLSSLGVTGISLLACLRFLSGHSEISGVYLSCQ